MGSAWAADPINVGESFETTFDAYLHDGSPGADGIALVVQASGPRALGGWGGGLGYRGLRQSVAVEFDDFENSTDPSDNHVGLVVNHNPDYHLVTAEAGIPLFGAPFRARVVWNAGTSVLRVYLGTADSASEARLLIDQTVDLRERLGGDTAWIGFTGATGNATAEQDILSWSVTTPKP
jgi:hypothetical protein